MADGILDGISNAVSGAGDFFLNRGRYADPNAINAQFGVPEQDVRQAGINTLANVSSLLLAAGQPMTGSERAKLLAGIGPALGGMQTDIFKSSQARLMTAQQRGAMEEARGLASLGERIKTDPEGVGKLIGRDADFVRANTPTNIMKIMQSIGTRDPVQQQLSEAQLRQIKAGEEATPTIRALLEQDPVYGKPEMAAAREMIIVDKSLRDEFIKSKTQRQGAQFEPTTVMGADNKPIVGQRNVVTGEFKPYSQGGVNINMGEKGAGEIDTKRIQDTQKSVRSMSTIAAPLEIAQRQLVEGNLDTGVITNATLGIRKLMSGLGILPQQEADKLAGEELFNSVTNFIVPRMRVEGSGSTSNYEDQLFQSAAPQLSKTRNGNILITSYLKQNIDYERAYARAMDKYYRDNKGSLGGFDDFAAQNVPPPVQSVENAEQYRALKKGTMYYSPQKREFLIKRGDN
jgi:hypothetical protein